MDPLHFYFHLAIPDSSIGRNPSRLHSINNFFRQLLVRNNNHRFGPEILHRIPGKFDQIGPALFLRIVDNSTGVGVEDIVDNALSKCLRRVRGRPDQSEWARWDLDVSEERSDAGSCA